MNLSDIKPPAGQVKKKQRVGQGMGTGRGKYSGRGAKGAKSISGYSRMRGFEGGQMPLHRRLPKKGFNNFNFKTVASIVNLAQLDKHFEAGETVNEESLRAKGLVSRKCDIVKVLGQGQITKKLTVAGCALSASAKEKIEQAGGSVEG